MRAVVVGGGPSGLALALGLAKQDIQVLLIDPRLGEYYRPGHLTPEVFRKIKGHVPEKFFEQWNHGRHIKDLERLLYQIAQERPRSIELAQGQFIEFRTDEQGKPVLVYQQDGQLRTERTDYVFDCSGSARAVLKAAHRVDPKLVFETASQAQPIVPDHLFYYCSMALVIGENLGRYSPFKGHFSSLTASAYYQMMAELRQFGWSYTAFPSFYAYRFSKEKEKFLLYCELPPDLAPSRHADWVNTLIRYKTGSPTAAVRLLRSEIPAKQAVREMAFQMNFNRLQQVGCEARPGLPNILALGDALIGFDYRLAHGALDGLREVKALLKIIEGYKGGIAYYDFQNIGNQFKQILNAHEGRLLAASQKEKQRHEQGAVRLLDALTVIGSQKAFDFEQVQLLEELQLRKLVREACDQIKRLKTSGLSQQEVYEHYRTQLGLIADHFTRIGTFIIYERQQAHAVMQEGLEAMKTRANDYMQKKQPSQAIALYELGASLAEKVAAFDLAYVFYSNAVIAHKKMNQINPAFELIKKALLELPNQAEFSPRRAKLIFNLFDLASQDPKATEITEFAKAYTEDAALQALPLEQRRAVEKKLLTLQNDAAESAPVGPGAAN